MTDGKVHGTDCFEVDSFLQKNKLSKLYHVRHKETSMFYTMEVSSRDSSSKAPISPYVQQPTTRFSPFLVNLRFTFQTRSKFYYILDFPGKETLSQRAKSFGGTFPEPKARFYAAEILIALEELHNFGLAYNELSLDTVYVEFSGHVMLWRNFCGKFYWSKRECVCSLHGFSHGDPCNNNHKPKSDFDFQEDWRTFGSVLYTMLTGKNSPNSVTNDRSLSVSASDLISRLVRGDVCRSEQIKSHPFFKGVNWNEVKKKETQPPMGSDSEPIRSQTSASPSFSSVRADVPTSPSSYRPQGTLHQRDSPLGADLDDVPESYRPRTLSHGSDPSMSTYGESGPFSPLRPHSLSQNSDPGDSGCVKSAPNFMAPGLHHAASTPDLRRSGQESSVVNYHHSYLANDVNYHHGYPDHYGARAGAYPATPNMEVKGRHVLTSRSLSDLSNLGFDVGYGSQSPTAIQRSFAYPSYEGDPLHREMFYLRSDSASPRIYNGEYKLYSAGSVPDLTTSSPPYFNLRDARASPTPSQYSDYSSFSAYTASPSPSPRDACLSPRSRLSENGFSPNESGYGTRGSESSLGFTRYDQNSSREFEYLRYNSEIPSGCRRGESPSPSTPQRFFGYPSPQNMVPSYKAKTQNNSLHGLDPTTKTDSSRSSTVGGRDRPSLSRAMSLSNLGKATKRLITEEVSEKRRDSLPLSVGSPREKYPLARVPIPSFREFKQKNVEKYSKSSRVDENAHTKDVGLGKSPKTVKYESKSNTDVRTSLEERLSSLYESAKDISAQNTTKRLSTANKVDSSGSEGYKLNSSGNGRIDKNIAKSGESMEPKHDTSKETKISRKISRGRQESPFSKNEVIHQLMLKYGLYEKGSQKKSRSPKNERKAISSGNISLDGKERENDEKEPQRLSSGGRGKLMEDRETNWQGATDQTNGSTLVDSPLSSRKTSQGITGEARKSAAERFRELRRKNGICKDVSESSLDVTGVTSKVKSTESNSIDRIVVENYSTPKASQKNDLESSVMDRVRARPLALKSKAAKDGICASNSEPINAKPDSSNVTKNSFSLRGTSRAILCASKFKRVANKELSTTKDSPLPDRKQLSKIIDKTEETTKHKNQETENNSATSPTNLIDVKRNRSFDRASPRTRRRRFQEDRGLRKGGIHTSMLSVASSACSDTEVDDTVSICSEMDDERGSRSRRWESFHSNMSADSGSAHMFEFETDSNIAEYDEVFDYQDSEDDHPKFEVDVERTDSGVGGDMGKSPLRRSWEEIKMKSSEHWSIVAASARHWQELARRKKANENEPSTTPRKKSSTHSITEDMVECPDCLKHYVPPEEQRNAREPQICVKCKDRKVERKEAIIELVQTEINYGNDLQILKEEFYLPMQSGGILSPENLAAIFLNLQELLEVNSKFCAKLQKSLEDSVANGDEEFSDVNVGSIFLENVDFFQAYEIYCSKQAAASALLESLQKKTELLRIFLNVTCRENTKCRKMDLNSFILAPVQRIMKYPLLLSRICKATPRRSTDREKLKVAQRKIEEQLNKINALNTTVESRQRRYRASQQLGRSDSLDKLQMKKMASDILNWTMEEMQLLMHGVFEVTIHEFGAAWNRRNSKKALSVCALFCVRGHSEVKLAVFSLAKEEKRIYEKTMDQVPLGPLLGKQNIQAKESLRIDCDDEGQCDELLFPGEGEVTDAAVVLLRKKISGKYTLFKDPLFLDMCVIYRDSELKDAFEVLSVGKESYVFRASTSREYRRWVKYLRLESKELGAWKRRRNGLPNIMIKNL